MKATVLVIYLLASFGGFRTAVADVEVDYARDVKPIFQARCYACHGTLKQEGNLRLDSVELMRQGGDSGAAIEPGDAKATVLLDRISDPDESSRMPQQGAALKAKEIDLIARWIQQGAIAPLDDAPESDPREHWAFKQLVRPEVPKVSDSKLRIGNLIDSFVAAEQVRRGLKPVDEADKPALLRRVYLDLIGLPPTREELHEFLSDSSPDAYEKVVDRLLASPQYGERWGRHWMDVWRYSDWYGRRNANDVMNSYPTIWRWRDWIVRSLNEDKGYDRMVVEMLAADEVAPDDDANLIATGYLARNYFRWNYNQWMKDNVEHTAKAFLGLTLNCAHCHDHKYDPISQEEYFAFRAFFEPLELRHDRVEGSPDPGLYHKYVYLEKWNPIKGGMVRVFDEKLDAETRMYSGGDERNLMEDKPPVEPRVPAILGIKPTSIEPITLPPVAVYPGLKPFIESEELAKAQAAIAQAEKVAAKARANLRKSAPDLTAQVEVAQAKVSKLEADQFAENDGPPQAITGQQSLFLDAVKGRRTLSNDVANLDAVQEGTTVAFQILLIADKQANFQLALNTATGATAACIAFQDGRVLTYRPDTWEFAEIGNYNLSAGPSRFQVVVVLHPKQDQITLSVTEIESGAPVVKNAAGALHGWNPAGRPEQGIIVDARPGTVVAFDEITLTQPGANPAIRFDFEPPVYAVLQDVVGHQGWKELPFCVAPATSIVSQRTGQPGTLASARKQLAMAQHRLEALQLGMPAAETELVAAKESMSALKARIAAGKARYAKSDDASALAREASRAERTATHAKAVAEEQANEAALAAVEAKPGGDKERAAAQAKCDKSHEAVVAATEALMGDHEAFSLITPTYPTQSTGRRSALARAIVDRDNPLTARVAANHIWMRHFGRPLVESVFDFGRNGKRPSHPELLDWLAIELRDTNWSMKHLHRLIATSATYRASSAAAADSANFKLDPDDQFLWRFPRQSMQSEVVRDSILHTAGQLDWTLGGAEIEQADADQTRRRSIYISHHGEGRAALLETFNAPSPTDCYRRLETVVPQQALAFANGKLALDASRIVARNLWEQTCARVPVEEDRDSAFIDAAFEQLLSRLPHSLERQASLDLLELQIETYHAARVDDESAIGPRADRPSSDPAMRARESLVHALYSHHDFISVR